MTKYFMLLKMAPTIRIGGRKIPLSSAARGLAGVMLVFKSEKAAKAFDKTADIQVVMAVEDTKNV